MFKKICNIFIVVCLLNLTSAKSVQKPEEITVLRSQNENLGDSGYKFSYELSDSQKREEVGTFKNLDKKDRILSVKGSYSYIGPDGITYSVKYVADENGFQPSGDHLPTSQFPKQEIPMTIYIEEPLVEIHVVPPPKPLHIPQSALLSLVG